MSHFHIFCCVPCFSRGGETWSYMISEHFQGIRLCIGQQAAPLCADSFQVWKIQPSKKWVWGLIAIIWVILLVPQHGLPESRREWLFFIHLRHVGHPVTAAVVTRQWSDWCGSDTMQLLRSYLSVCASACQTAAFEWHRLSDISWACRMQ